MTIPFQTTNSLTLVDFLMLKTITNTCAACDKAELGTYRSLTVNDALGHLEYHCECGYITVLDFQTTQTFLSSNGYTVDSLAELALALKNADATVESLKDVIG